MVLWLVSAFTVLIGLGQMASAEETSENSIKPFFTYRYAGLTPRLESPYHNTIHQDSVDQIYAAVKYSATADYVHQAVVELALRTERENPSDIEHLFEQAYVDTQVIENLTFTAGKKTEFEGSGMIVNPSDLLNEDKDLFDSLYQREGKVFTRIRYSGDWFAISTAYVPFMTRSWHAGKVWNQISLDVLDTDIRIQHSYRDFDKSTFGLSFSKFFTDRFEFHTDSRYQSRQRSFADQTFDKQLRFMDYSSYERDDSSLYYLFGSRYVLTSRRTIIAEYVTQQSGLEPSQFKEMFEKFLDSPAVETTPTRLMGRHYGFLSYQDDDTINNVHLGLTWLKNTDDGSWFGTASVKRHLSNVASLEFVPTLFSGSRFSEFGAMPFSEAYYMVVKGQF